MKSVIKSLLIGALVSAFVVFAPSVAEAQNYHTTSKKAVKYYKSAKKQYDKKNYPKSMKYLDKALSTDARFCEAILLKGDMALITGDENQAIRSYERLFKVDSTAFPRKAITLSNLYMKNYRYNDAVNILKWYVSTADQKDKNLPQAKELLEKAEFRDVTYSNPVKYDPQNLGENVNTAGDEYINQILPDGTRLYFTRRSLEVNKQGVKDESLYSAAIVDSEYMPAIPMNLDWHNNKRMGAMSMTANQNRMYFVGIDFIDSQGRGDIYMSDFVENDWSKPVNLGNVVNTSMMESQPCISADGKEMYFVRSSKNYGSDIYVSEYYQGRWSNPKPVKSVNTKGNEMSPFIHPDGNTLYFASDGLTGMGGYDIFKCKKIDRDLWSEPVNLGYPINSDKNEISFVVSTDGKKAYISTDRDGGIGGYDIYVFELDEVDGPDPVDERRFVMHNVNFAFDSAKLTSSSDATIDSLASFMSDNPSIMLEISGYTDNSGSYDHNQTLSTERAIAVKNALVERGIDESRMVAVGYGQNRPLVPNDDEKNKAINRRVEVRVIY